jgi:hypothetical protein
MPLVEAGAKASFCLPAKASAYGYASPLKIPNGRQAPWFGILDKPQRTTA